jgi:Tol biopolymer transport system component
MTAEQVLIVDARGVHITDVDSPATSRLIVPGGRWPAWNPLFDLLAVSVVEGESSQVRLVDLDGKIERTLYEIPAGVPPVIAPLVPHYVQWSPGGTVLSYVAQGTYGMTLFLSHREGLFGPDAVINAGPLFSAWCTDNNFLAVHAGEELSVIEIDGSRTTAEVAPRTAGYRTPAYSDDAEVLAYARIDESGSVQLIRAKFQGTGSEPVCAFPGGVALAFRPGTQLLTVAVARDPETGGFDELWLVDLSTEDYPKRKIHSGQFVSFLWSPPGERLAVVVPSYGGDGRYAVRILEPDGSPVATSEAFQPSEDYRIYLAFFDQYVNSHSLWSPDGCSLLIGGRVATDSVSPAFGDPDGDYVFIWTPLSGMPMRLIRPGGIGFYPPLPKPLR